MIRPNRPRGPAVSASSSIIGAPTQTLTQLTQPIGGATSVINTNTFAPRPAPVPIPNSTPTPRANAPVAAAQSFRQPAPVHAINKLPEAVGFNRPTTVPYVGGGLPTQISGGGLLSGPTVSNSNSMSIT